MKSRIFPLISILFFLTSLGKAIPAHAQLNSSQGSDQKITEKLTEKLPDKLPEKLPEKLTEKTTGFSVNPSTDNLAENSINLVSEEANKNPNENSDEKSTGIPGEVSNENSLDNSAQNSDESSPSEDEESPPDEPKKDKTKTGPKTKPTTWIANIVRAKNGKQISDLELQFDKVPIVLVQGKESFRPLVEIPLIYKRADWKLFVQKKIPVTPGLETNKFRVFAYINSRINEMELVARGPNGEIEIERIFIYAPEAQEFKVVSPWDAVKLSIGSTYLHYSQTGFYDFYSWSGLLSAQIHSDEKGGQFGFLAESSVTTFTAQSNQNNYGPQIINGMIDGVYFKRWPPASLWRIQFLFGVNFITMYSNGAPFGMNNLITPEAGIRLRKIIDRNSDYLAEFRCQPMSDSFDLNQRGINLSISKSWILPNLHRAEIGLRLNDLVYEPDLNSKVELTTTSFVLSYSL